jgi:hypothetical protein
MKQPCKKTLDFQKNVCFGEDDGFGFRAVGGGGVFVEVIKARVHSEPFRVDKRSRADVFGGGYTVAVMAVLFFYVKIGGGVGLYRLAVFVFWREEDAYRVGFAVAPYAAAYSVLNGKGIFKAGDTREVKVFDRAVAVADENARAEISARRAFKKRNSAAV